MLLVGVIRILHSNFIGRHCRPKVSLFCVFYKVLEMSEFPIIIITHTVFFFNTALFYCLPPTHDSVRLIQQESLNPLQTTGSTRQTVPQRDSTTFEQYFHLNFVKHSLHCVSPPVDRGAGGELIRHPRDRGSTTVRAPPPPAQRQFPSHPASLANSGGDVTGTSLPCTTTQLSSPTRKTGTSDELTLFNLWEGAAARRLDWGEKKTTVSFCDRLLYLSRIQFSLGSQLVQEVQRGLSTAGLNLQFVGGELAFDFYVPSTLFFACG